MPRGELAPPCCPLAQITRTVITRGIGVISFALSLFFTVSVRATEPPAPAPIQNACTQLGQLYQEIQSHECDLQICRDPASGILGATEREQRAWANSQCAALYDGVFERYKAVCGVALDYDSTTFEELGKVLTFYQEAYLCTPGFEHADYLHRALWRVASAKEALETTRAKFAADDAGHRAIEAKLATLEVRASEISALFPPQPQPQPNTSIELVEGPPVELPSEEPTTTPLTQASAFLEMLSLRLVAGLGGVKELNPGGGFIRREGGAYGFGIAGGLRLGLGQQKRHLLEAGAEYVVIQHMGAALLSRRGEGCDAPDICGLAPAMQYLSVSFGYGYRILKDHLSVRARAGLGYHVLAVDPGFGRRFGLIGASVCSVWEILCLSLTGRGSGGLFSNSNMTSGLATLEIDLLRIPAARRAINATHP